MVQKNDGTAHALNAHIEGDTRAKRGLLKNQGNEFAVERGGVTAWAGLDVRRKMEQFTRMRGAPFRSGEKIIRQGNGGNESSSGHFFISPCCRVSDTL